MQNHVNAVKWVFWGVDVAEFQLEPYVFQRVETLTVTGSNIDKARFAIALCFREEFSVR